MKKWSLYWVNHDPVIGSEQSGTRPALVISNDMVNEILPVTTILPVSSLKQDSRVFPTEVLLTPKASGLQKPSVVMVHQIRTVSKLRIGKKCGEITDENVKKEIIDTMKEYFEI
ncbi:MAG: type II toxin-antitoxin system PemK/MazF family toxin [Ruminiclostridium sp.]|nr:type II toxin-antitoxin system PemK/MazF family toxin [Ruminiclostridium sp.]